MQISDEMYMDLKRFVGKKTDSVMHNKVPMMEFSELAIWLEQQGWEKKPEAVSE